jgi:hypothetical protein
MGATVTVGKKVAAFKANNGKVGYVLFEETYEKNCYPHNPHWSCVGIGYLDDVMTRIFAMASSCEGGGLQGRGGYITPEGYISGWLNELAEPLEMPNFKNKVAFGSNFYATIPESLRERVLKGLEEEGFNEQAKALCVDGFEATLHDDIDVLRAIYVKHRNELGPWRFISSSFAIAHYMPYCKELGYTPLKDKTYQTSVPKMFEVHTERLAVEQPDGVFRVDGASYWCTAMFIASYGLTELAHPGTFRKSIKAFRESVKIAPKASDDTVIVVSMNGLPEDQRYRRGLVQMVADALGKTSTEFETTLGDIRRVATSDNDLMYNLTSLNTLEWKPKMAPAPIHQESLFGEMEIA